MISYDINKRMWDIDASVQSLHDSQAFMDQDTFRNLSDLKWYDPTSQASLHDSWIFGITTEYATLASPRKRYLNITINLLGAYHDRFIFIVYQQVTASSLDMLATLKSYEILAHEFDFDNPWLLHRVRTTEGEFEIKCKHVSFSETLTKTS